MGLIVVKFGGTSVADTDKIERAADKVVREIEMGNQVIVVVSAMAGVTNQLIGYCTSISPLHDLKEYDVVVSSGEQITSGLMALALQKRGYDASSFLGWQVPIYTSDVHGKAKILNVEKGRIQNALDQNEIVVVSGFQGVSSEGRISTLGRGGSDTTAVALAAAMDAERCDIYTDVDGVYTADPRVVEKARKISHISYEEMLELAFLGTKVLHPRSVEIGLKEDVHLQVLSSFNEAVGSTYPGTLIVKERDETMEDEVVTGVTCKMNEAKITIENLPDTPGVAEKVFEVLEEANINVDMISQSAAPDGKYTNMTFTLAQDDLEKAILGIKSDQGLKDFNFSSASDMAKVSIVGVGMESSRGVARRMFSTLADEKINISVITTSQIKISVLINGGDATKAVKSLHSAFNLDGP